MMNSIEKLINFNILEYPSIFGGTSHKMSRLLVLNHLFFVIGNGYDWHVDGYLANSTSIKGEVTVWLPSEQLDSLPSDFFVGEYLPEYVTNKYKQDKSFIDIKRIEEKLGLGLNSLNQLGKRVSHINYYPLCDSSKLVEMVDNKIILLPDWREAAIEVSMDAILYYNEIERYKYNIYYRDEKQLERWEARRQRYLQTLESCIKYLELSR